MFLYFLIFLFIYVFLNISFWIYLRSSSQNSLFFFCLAANHLSINSEITEDLKRLCVVFEHVEKLLTVAASLHRKFLQALRLSEVIFSVYYNLYQPKMGTGLVGNNGDMVISQNDLSCL